MVLLSQTTIKLKKIVTLGHIHYIRHFLITITKPDHQIDFCV
jgi:hypothetical protein